MRTINEFLATNNPSYELSVNELMCVKGGDTPVGKPKNPFIRKVMDFLSMLKDYYSTSNSFFKG